MRFDRLSKTNGKPRRICSFVFLKYGHAGRELYWDYTRFEPKLFRIATNSPELENRFPSRQPVRQVYLFVLSLSLPIVVICLNDLADQVVGVGFGDLYVINVADLWFKAFGHVIYEDVTVDLLCLTLEPALEKQV